MSLCLKSVISSVFEEIIREMCNNCTYTVHYQAAIFISPFYKYFHYFQTYTFQLLKIVMY